MASTSIINIILVAAAILLAYDLRSRIFPISRDVKRSLGYHEDSLLNFTELSGKYGYNSEQHTFATEDGYVLTIFRINSKKCAKIKRLPVILMHGLLLSSDIWLDAGPDNGLAYLIADACHDLWVGNQRGNYYSRRHERLDPDKNAEFWQFSVDEIGRYDIPATIDYVLKYTQEPKLNYIGYSQGAGSFLIMCSERPRYCDRVNVFIALAPASRLINTKSTPFRLFLSGMRLLGDVLSITGNNEIFAKDSFSSEILAFMCKFSAMSEFVCGNLLSIIDVSHPGSITKETLRRTSGHFPAGTSARTIARYGQSLNSDRFQKYDHGKEKNLKVYGEDEPPSYNLSAVTAPSVVIYGNNDYMVNKTDVLWMIKQLPNVLEAVEVSDPLWNHFDVPYSQFTKDLIFPKIKEYLHKNSQD